MTITAIDRPAADPIPEAPRLYGSQCWSESQNVGYPSHEWIGAVAYDDDAPSIICRNCGAGIVVEQGIMRWPSGLEVMLDDDEIDAIAV